jgi:hypothetical protein
LDCDHVEAAAGKVGALPRGALDQTIAERTRDVPVHTAGDRTRDRESMRQHPQGS